MQSYISHQRETVFYHLINFLSSKSCPIHLLRKISEVIENMIFSLIFVFTGNMIFPFIVEYQDNMILTLHLILEL